MSVTQEGEPIEVGMPVEAKFRGLTYKQGHVTNVRADGTVDISYIDGEQVTYTQCQAGTA
jgi:hypothetical protein